eukprot:evm.model.scf_229.4 EVM.evm.TU.scf_229.4   scf_229:40004-41663(-)
MTASPWRRARAELAALWACLGFALLARGESPPSATPRASDALATGPGLAGGGGRGECFAVVEYVASVGDPLKANKSELFRGEVTVFAGSDSGEIASGVIHLGWTFTAGERLKGKRDIFVDTTEFTFSAETVEHQRIMLSWNESAGAQFTQLGLQAVKRLT